MLDAIWADGPLTGLVNNAAGNFISRTEDLSVKGFEAITALDPALDGLAPPLKLTPEDHEGGGWVQVWTIKGGKFTRTTDWFQGYRETLMKHLAAESAKQ